MTPGWTLKRVQRTTPLPSFLVRLCIRFSMPVPALNAQSSPVDEGRVLVGGNANRATTSVDSDASSDDGTTQFALTPTGQYLVVPGLPSGAAFVFETHGNRRARRVGGRPCATTGDSGSVPFHTAPPDPYEQHTEVQASRCGAAVLPVGRRQIAAGVGVAESGSKDGTRWLVLYQLVRVSSVAQSAELVDL